MERPLHAASSRKESAIFVVFRLCMRRGTAPPLAVEVVRVQQPWKVYFYTVSHTKFACVSGLVVYAVLIYLAGSL